MGLYLEFKNFGETAIIQLEPQGSLLDISGSSFNLSPITLEIKQ